MDRPPGFQFMTASYVIRINNQRAFTMNELRTGLDQASDASIFYHTFQSLGRHHFLTEGFSNEFAQWALAGLNRPQLAERLGGLDVRDYLSLAELRADLLRIIAEYREEHPREAEISGFEPFHFCECAEVTAPLGPEVHSLKEFREALEKLGHASLYYHFLVSRLRLKLQTNDFSNWLAGAMGRQDLAQRINRIDIYTNTLDGARERMVRIVSQGERQ
jgi:Family of unknown function (DUF5752)